LCVSTLSSFGKPEAHTLEEAATLQELLSADIIMLASKQNGLQKGDGQLHH